MGEENVGEFSAETLKELRNDFTFFVAMSLLKTLAAGTPDSKKFIKEIVLKWREKQVQALHMVSAEMDRRMFEDSDFEEVFGAVIRQANKAQRGAMIDSIRKFCDTVEEALITSMESGEQDEEGEGTLGEG